MIADTGTGQLGTRRARRPFTSVFLGTGALALAAGLSPGLSAQQQSERAVAVESGLLLADSLHQSGDPLGAVEVLQHLAEERPNNVDVLIATAREAVVVGIVSSPVALQNEWFERGEGFAARALELDPDNVAAEYWLVVAQGKRATHSSPLTAARLGISVYQRTHRLLARDSLHAGANHALGVLNFEVMKMSAPMRFIARTLAPHGYLRDTSWENAESYIGRAVELEPEFLLYRLDLGKTYYFQGRYDSARRWFQSVLDCPPLDVPTDPVFRAEAQRYLGFIDEESLPRGGA